MDSFVHCQSCQTPLRVPATACGHRVRCTACGHDFIVPSGNQLIEETCFTWIEQDVDQALNERHEQNEKRLAAHLDREQVNPAVTRAQSAAPPAFYPRRTRQSKLAKAPDDGAPELLASVREGWTAPDAADDASPSPAAGTDRSVPAPTEEAPNFPQDLQLTKPGPHLVIERVDHAGVHFAFDAHWLTHEGFRASMPMRCVFSGDRHRDHLLARPALFIDQLRRRQTSAPTSDLVGEHEVRTLGDHHPREIAAQMGRIAPMPHPFDLGLPYYISHRYAHMRMHCATRDRRDGKTCCIVIPDAACALDWLGNVNGICGEEYLLLLKNVSMLHGEAWRDLSERCRQRITAWCKLRPREELRLYLPDADFNRHDEGLSGLVITDQRLVFCKFHHRGQIKRDQTGATILLKPGRRFIDLQLRVGQDVSKMTRIHHHDLDRLTAELRGNQGLTIQTPA